MPALRQDISCSRDKVLEAKYVRDLRLCDTDGDDFDARCVAVAVHLQRLHQAVVYGVEQVYSDGSDSQSKGTIARPMYTSCRECLLQNWLIS
jgi:hypothetical protein